MISNDDENDDGITYEPARVLATLRLYDPQDDIEIVLLACVYLEKVSLTVDEKKQLPSDNMYRYLFKGPPSRRHLWIDLITVNRINGPLIGINDPDSTLPIIDTITQAKTHKFIIQRPFFRDSTHECSKKSNEEFHKLVDNLFTYIPLPDNNEFKLFSIYSNNKLLIDENINNENAVVDDAIFDDDDVINEHI